MYSCAGVDLRKHTKHAACFVHHLVICAATVQGLPGSNVAVVGTIAPLMCAAVSNGIHRSVINLRLRVTREEVVANSQTTGTRDFDTKFSE